MMPADIYGTAGLLGVEGDRLILRISSRVSGVDNTHNPPVCPIFQGFIPFGHKNTPPRQSYPLDFYATAWTPSIKSCALPTGIATQAAVY